MQNSKGEYRSDLKMKGEQGRMKKAEGSREGGKTSCWSHLAMKLAEEQPSWRNRGGSYLEERRW